MGTVRTRRGFLQTCLGKRPQTPSSSPKPFSCYAMQRMTTRCCECAQRICLTIGVHAKVWEQAGNICCRTRAKRDRKMQREARRDSETARTEKSAGYRFGFGQLDKRNEKLTFIQCHD